jgi:TENA/THI-4/PQQC family protein
VLQAFAGEQYVILHSDRASFAQLAARYPDDPSASFFLSMAAGEGQALAHLLRLATALGQDEADLTAYEPRPGCQAYPAFLAWLALHASRLDVAVALLVNLDAWGANCGRMGHVLRHRYGLSADAVGFFEFFATPPPGLRDQIIAVASDGRRRGDATPAARRAARLLQAYELMFWDSLLEDVSATHGGRG